MDFDYGSIMVPLGVQDDPEKVHALIKNAAEEDNITVYAISTGLTPKGIDLGSNSFVNLTIPKVMMIGGSGTNSSEVGDIWHLFDQRYHMPLSIVEQGDVNGRMLDRYKRNCDVLAVGLLICLPTISKDLNDGLLLVTL